MMKSRLLPVLWSFFPLSLPAASAQSPAPVPSPPVPPGLFTLSDPSLEVTVWAQSPMLHNPTNIDIDKDGCIWVAEGVNYRMHFNRQPEGDRIMVLQDTDGDGKADKSWPFVQEKFLRAPLGVAVIGNKVVVSMAPDLVVYTDKDGDKKFDPAKGDTREVLLTGFNGRNHDHSLHSVTVGPDGKWYFSAGNCGAKFTDKSGKTFRIGSKQNVSWWPKDPERPDGDPNEYAGQKSDDGNVYVGGFIARMNPDGTNVEILAHNLRNSYENCVTSFGDIFASDNDDQPACRVFGVLEGGNYGFASADGSRTWQADRRPGQDVKTATWRQEDPGVAPAGDIYGGGAPTGCVFYENGALGEKHEGTLLVCESALNTIFGYKPQPDGAGWKLERFNFLTTNQDGKIIGTDSTGGNQTAKADDTKTLFRPSDIAVGPDGAIYLSDWFDPRTGGHADMDDSLSGTIYRVAPKGFKPVVPTFDLATVEGAIEALKSPAVHVRALGGAMPHKSARTFAEAFRVLEKLEITGDPFTERVKSFLKHSAQAHLKRAHDFSIADLSSSAGAWLSASFTSLEYSDLELWGLACAGKESAVYDAILPKLGDPDPLKWSDKFAALAWRLHPPQSVPAFKTRALSAALPLKARKDALTAIGFNAGAEAAQAMLEIAEKTSTPASDPVAATPLDAAAAAAVAGSPETTVHDLALWWLLNRKDNVWKDHGLATALKAKGIYDPDTVTLSGVSLPDPPPAAFTVEEAMKLTGDAKRGEGTSQRCYMCHRIGDNGAEFGPDLTTWGHTQGTEVILRSLITPSADIAHGFEGMRLETTDGLLIDGLVLTDADPVIIRSMGGLTQTVPKVKIKSRKSLDRSLMMSATQLGLTPQDCADLAAFLRK
ncbi:MAG: PVC-type heme-binding CxxCH protein [Verrucomicrobiota bacterium]